MSDAASNPPPPADAIWNADGSITVPPDQAALLGPPESAGSHLKLVKAPQLTWRQISEDAATWQRQQGIPELSEEEAIEMAVRVTRETRHLIAEEEQSKQAGENAEL